MPLTKAARDFTLGPRVIDGLCVLHNTATVQSEKVSYFKCYYSQLLVLPFLFIPITSNSVCVRGNLWIVSRPQLMRASKKHLYGSTMQPEKRTKPGQWNIYPPIQRELYEKKGSWSNRKRLTQNKSGVRLSPKPLRQNGKPIRCPAPVASVIQC